MPADLFSKARRHVLKIASGRTVLWVGFYGVLSAVFCAPLFKSPYATGVNDWDQHLFYYGAVLKNVVEYGAPPFWNPWYCGGNVLWQNPQIALLSPAYPLALAVPLPLAMKVNIVLHYWIGFIGMHLLLTRAIGLTFLPLVGYLAALFTLSGALVLHLAVGHSVFLPAFYLPLQLFFFIRALKTGRVRDALPAGAVLALMVLNGGLHIIPMSVAAIGVCSVTASIVRREWRPMLVALALGVAGSAYAAPKLLPVIRFVTSDRYWDTRPPTARPDRTSAEMLFHVYLDEYQDRSLKFQDQRHGWYEYGNYIGSLAALLIASSIVWIFVFRKTPEWWMGLSLAVTSLLLLALSAGEFSPLAPASLATHLPLFAEFRIPSRFTVGFVLFAATTVAWVAHAVAPEMTLTGKARGLAAMACVLATLQLLVRNGSQLDNVFSGPISSERFHVFGGSDVLVNEAGGNPYAAGSPMYSALMRGHSFFNCYESLQLTRTALEDHPLVFTDDSSKIFRTSFSPNRVEFTAVGGGEPSRIVLNQNFADGWRSGAGPVTIEPRSKKPVVMLSTTQAGTFFFAFVPPGLVLGVVLSVAAMIATVVVSRSTTETTERTEKLEPIS